MSGVKFVQELLTDYSFMLECELSSSVIEEVRQHWQEKISNGIVLTEVKNRGTVDFSEHMREMHSLARFEGDVVDNLFKGRWKPKAGGDKVSELHYFGIGLGTGLAQVVPVANRARHEIVAYDTCQIGCDNGAKVFAQQNSKYKNRVLLADIHFACKRRYIRPGKASKLIVPRVLDVLDTQDPDREKKLPRERKMAKTARRIGELLRHLEVLLIHPCKEDNLNAVCGDCTLHSLSEVLEYMEEGRKGKLDAQVLGTTSFFGHIYTAVVIGSKKP